MSKRVSVSIRPQLESTATRCEVRPNLELARSLGMGVVKMEPGGRDTAALVTMRTILRNPNRFAETWELLISPLNEYLLRRLLARRVMPMDAAGRTIMPGLDDAADLVVPHKDDVRYEMMRALQAAHHELSALDPRYPGAYVELTLGIDRDLVRVGGISRASENEFVRRQRGQARAENTRRRANYEAACWPLSNPWKFGPLRWPLGEKPSLKLLNEPDLPQSDRWAQGSDQWDDLLAVAERHFAPIMESLWKAAFMHDPYVAGQLEAQGYDLSRIDATRVGGDALLELMRSWRSGDKLTQMATPELEDLKPVDLEALSRTGLDHEDYSLVIDDSEDYDDEDSLP